MKLSVDQIRRLELQFRDQATAKIHEAMVLASKADFEEDMKVYTLKLILEAKLDERPWAKQKKVGGK